MAWRDKNRLTVIELFRLWHAYSAEERAAVALDLCDFVTLHVEHEFGVDREAQKRFGSAAALFDYRMDQAEALLSAGYRFPARIQ